MPYKKAGRGQQRPKEKRQRSTVSDKGLVPSGLSSKLPIEKLVEIEESTCDSDSDAVTIASNDGLDGEPDAQQTLDKIEGLLELCLELLVSKSKNQRIDGCLKLISAFRMGSPANFDVVTGNIATLCDALERLLRKVDASSADEAVVVLRLVDILTLLSLALEDTVSEEIFSVLRPVALKLMQDPTVPAVARTAAVRTAVLTTFFIAPSDRMLLKNSLNATYKTFEPSLPKGDDTMPNLGPAAMGLHTGALEAFLLLLTLCSHQEMSTRKQGLIKDLTAVMRHADVDIRCTAGMGIALLCELLCTGEEGEEHLLPYKQLNAVLDNLSAYATDSAKTQGKKDRKEQRNMFRAIVSTVESNGEFMDHAKNVFKHGSDLTDVWISSWEEKIKYDLVTQVLGPGLATHLVRNEGLRDHFDVSRVRGVKDALCKKEGAAKARQRERCDEEKRRHLVRNKGRQKRNNAINIMDEDN